MVVSSVVPLGMKILKFYQMYIFYTLWKVPIVWWMDEYSSRWSVLFLFSKECSIAVKAADLLIYYNQKLDLVQVLWQFQAVGVLSPSIGWIFWRCRFFCFDDCCCAAQTLPAPLHAGAAWVRKKKKKSQTLWCEGLSLVPADNRNAVIAFPPHCQLDGWKRHRSQCFSSSLELWRTHLLENSDSDQKHDVSSFPDSCQLGVGQHHLSVSRSSREWNPIAPQVSDISLSQVFLCELWLPLCFSSLPNVWKDQQSWEQSVSTRGRKQSSFFIIICAPRLPVEFTVFPLPLCWCLFSFMSILVYFVLFSVWVHILWLSFLEWLLLRSKVKVLWTKKSWTNLDERHNGLFNPLLWNSRTQSLPNVHLGRSWGLAAQHPHSF